MRIPSPKSSPRVSRMESTLPLHDFIYKNDVKNVKASITETNINVRDSKGRTALFLAATLNRYELIDVLLTSGCDVSVTDNFGNNPLHEAAEKGNTDVVNLLIAHSDCDLDARNCDGETALMKAAYYDYGEIARILLKTGADSDVTDSNGQTALLIALRESSHVTVEHLLKHGCDVSVTDTLGHTALYIAIHSMCNKSLDLAKTLLGSGYDILQDRQWLLSEEKHNLFYQDDEFYNRLLRILTHDDVTIKNLTSYSENDTKSMSSPALRRRKLATVTDLPSPRNFQTSSIHGMKSCSSPVSIRKVSSTELNGSSPSFSSIQRYFNTPPSSPLIQRRKSSGTSRISQVQNEAPLSPVMSMRRMTPCPPPTENMLGSPKLTPKLRVGTSISSSPTAVSSPVDISRKTSQTSPLVKGIGSQLSTSSSPFSSPESSNPNSPVLQRKLLQFAVGNYSVTSPLMTENESSGGVLSQRFQSMEISDSSPGSSALKCIGKQGSLDSATPPGSPVLKRIVKQGSLDSASPPGSPAPKRKVKQGSLDNATLPGSPALKRVNQGSLDSTSLPGSPKQTFRRQIMVKFGMNDSENSEVPSTKTVHRQLSVPTKSSVQFSANVEIIDIPRK